jgi:hypothetical protein
MLLRFAAALRELSPAMRTIMASIFFRGAPFQRHGRPVFFRPTGGRARGADACQKRESTAQSPIGASPPRYRPAAFWVELELKKKRGLSTDPSPIPARPCFAPENSCSGLVSQCQPPVDIWRSGLSPLARKGVVSTPSIIRSCLASFPAR